MTVEISDDKIWNRIEKGEITGFSMGGVGEYATEDVDIDNLEKSFNDAKVLKKWQVIIDATELDEGYQKKNVST